MQFTLDREDIGNLLRVLSIKTASLGLSIDFYIGGGAALTLSSDCRPTARDIDFSITDKKYLPLLLNAESEGIREGEIPLKRRSETSGRKDDWIEMIDYMAGFMTASEKHFTPICLFSDGRHGGLKVFLLKDAPQLALKLSRQTPRDKDYSDIAYLCRRLGITGTADLKKLWDAHVDLISLANRSTITDDVLEDRWGNIQRVMGTQSPPRSLHPALQTAEKVTGLYS